MVVTIELLLRISLIEHFFFNTIISVVNSNWLRSLYRLQIDIFFRLDLFYFNPHTKNLKLYNMLQQNLDKPLLLCFVSGKEASGLPGVVPKFLQCAKLPDSHSSSSAIKQIDNINVNFRESLKSVTTHEF